MTKISPAMPSASIFSQLMDVIEDRKANPPVRSYTTSLFQGGVARIGEKIIEEAGEVVEAAGEPVDTRPPHVVHETADLIYHVFVLLGHCNIPLKQLEAELQRRFGVSGLDEKAARDQGRASGE
jgi:phosphoribosyl-ATP pyrophosphohydrolase